MVFEIINIEYLEILDISLNYGLNILKFGVLFFLDYFDCKLENYIKFCDVNYVIVFLFFRVIIIKWVFKLKIRDEFL